MNTLRMSEDRVKVRKDGFTVFGDGLKFLYNAPAIQNLPIAIDTSKFSNSKYSGDLIKDPWDKKNEYETIIPLFPEKEKKNLFNDDYLKGYGLDKKQKSEELGINFLNDIDMGQLVHILGKLGNSLLTLEGDQTPNVSINCEYDPNANTLTALSVFPLSGNFIDKFNILSPKKRRIALAQRVCDRAIDELDINSAYDQFKGVREVLSDPISQTMLQYLNK